MDIKTIQQKYKALSIAEKLIVVNVGVFIILVLLSSLFKNTLLFNGFALQGGFMETLLKPWSILTYAFMHTSFGHLFFNMLTLYYISKMFLSLFDVKLFLNVYFLGAIVGALAFLLVFNLFPTLLLGGILIGASAAITALLIFLCASFPYQDVQVFTFKLKLWHIGAFFVALDVFQLFSDNAGGAVSHLGGALLGYVYAKQYAKGNNIGKGFEKMMDTLVGWFKTSKQPKMKTVHKTRRERNATHKTVYQKNRTTQNKTNEILDKISKNGYESLTKEEKEFLFKAK